MHRSGLKTPDIRTTSFAGQLLRAEIELDLNTILDVDKFVVEMSIKWPFDMRRDSDGP